MPVTPAGPLRPAVVVFDLDGVLADVRHRVHHVSGVRRDWEAFFAAAPQDPVLTQGRQMVESEAAGGRLAAYLTGRPERCRADTVAWLAQHGFPEGVLLMRPDTDRRPARLFKAEALGILAETHDIHLVVDDDPQVVVTLREHGFAVHQARWARDDDVDQVLTHVQEEQGRT